MPITDEEYEDAYVEALRCLAEDGRVVGEPFLDGGAAVLRREWVQAG